MQSVGRSILRRRDCIILRCRITTTTRTSGRRKHSTNGRTQHSSKKQEIRPEQQPTKSFRGDGGDAPKYVAPKALTIGMIAGICGSLAGMGGGFVMIPLMTSKLLRLSQHQAHGTSLFAVTTTGMAGALGYSGEVNFEAATAIAICGMVTARLGARLTSKLSEKKLKRALGIFMLSVAPLVPAKPYLVQYAERNTNENSTERGLASKGATERNDDVLARARAVAIPASIGLCSGFLAGLFGVGGGAIVVPALTLATDMSHVQSLGTSLAAMTLPAMVGTATHYSRGNVAMRVAPYLAVGAFVGGYAGGRLGLQANESALRWGFSLLMVTLGVRTYRGV